MDHSKKPTDNQITTTNRLDNPSEWGGYDLETILGLFRYKLAAHPLPNNLENCFFCTRRKYITGVFLPELNNQRRVFAPENRIRGFAYSLCYICFNTPGIQTRVVEIIFAKYDRIL
jgi:hypothetical protein